MNRDRGNVRPDAKAKTMAIEKPHTCEDFRRHISHTASNTCMQSALRIMNCNVEVGEMDVSVGIQKDIVRLDITAR